MPPEKAMPAPGPFTRSTLFCLLALLCFFSGEAAWAQEPAVGPGKRVRVASTSFDGVGLVTAQDANALTIVVENQAAPISVPWNRVSRLETRRSLSHGEGALEGAKWGVIITAPIALLVVLAPGGSDPAYEEFPGQIALGMITQGAAIGALVGLLRPGGTWERVSLPARMSIAPTAEKELSLSGSLGF